MTPTDWYSQAEMQGRIARLVARGFDCTSAGGGLDGLRYAEFEFQVYSMNAQWLARRSGDVWSRAPDQSACVYLRGAAGKRQPAEPWNATWEKCLLRWEGHVDPDHDQHPTEEPYACPVVIDRVQCDDEYPSEQTDSGDLEAANVWTITRADAGGFYFVRDFSGMFEISGTDPAYRSTKQWPVPDAMFEPDWLYAKRRSFMQVLPYEGEAGVAVQPWRVCEMLPALIGVDKQHVQQDDQWRRLFRLIRCMADVESDGYFDRLQGYDEGNLSIPLYHYTLDKKAADKGANSELGAVLAWLKCVDSALAARMASLGLSNVGKEWVDDNGWGKGYEAGSGSSMAAGPAGARVVSSAKVGAGGNIEWLRRPHFHYRVAMLLRTVPAIRVALWKMAVHRLRNIAWAECKLPRDLAGRRVLGRILTSEQAIAIALRLHIWLPGTLNNKVAPAIATAWKQATDATPDGDPARRQAIFEQAFCDHFVKKEPHGSNLNKVWRWPTGISSFPARLRQAHLEGDDDPPASAAMLPPLSRAPYSSPFWKKNPDQHGAPIFADPVDLVDRDPRRDFKGEGHPAASSRYTQATPTDDFGAFGTAVGLPASLRGPDAGTATFEQRVREALAVRAAQWVLVDGVLRPNPEVETRRPHSDGGQYWARRRLYEMRRDRVASALRFTTGAAAPAPHDSLWALDAAPGQTVRVFDWRDGTQGPGVAFASTDAAGVVTSLDRSESCAVAVRANFGIFATDLAVKTFDAFALALGSGAGVTHVDQFRAEPTTDGWQVALGGVRQRFSAKANGPARASEWGFLVEFLAWRYGRKGSADGWTGGPFDQLRMLGFDAWVPQASAGNPAFLRQPWPAAALGSGKAPNGGLDGMKLVAVPRLWRAPRPHAVPTETQVAAAMLTWPSLYRLRAMFQVSAQARRGLYDVWRIGMRAVLGLKPRILRQVFGPGATMYRLFQMPETIGALACWRYFDAGHLKRHFEASKEFASGARAWRDSDAGHADYTQWTWEHERAFFWDVVVASLPAGSLRDTLARLRPAAASVRTYQGQLAQVLDLDGLDEVPPPLADNEYQPVLLKQGGPSVGFGLLATELPPAALFAEQGVDYLVGGLVPVLHANGALQGVPLMLPEPVRVRLTQPAETHTSVTLHMDRDSAGTAHDFADLDLLEPFTIEADVSSWLGELADGLALTLVAEAQAANGGASVLRLALRLAAPWLHKPIVWAHEIGSINGIGLSAERLVWKTDFAGLADAGGLPLKVDPPATVELAIGLAGGTPSAVLRIVTGGVTVNLGSPIASLVLKAGDGLGFEADLVAGKARVVGVQGASVSLLLELAALVEKGMARLVPTDVRKGVRVPPFNILFNPFGGAPPPAAAVAAGVDAIDLSVPSAPRIAASLFRSGPASWGAQPECALLDFAPDWLAGLTQTRDALLKLADAPLVVNPADGQPVELTLPVTFEVGPMRAAARLRAGCAVDADGYLALTGNSFACALSDLHLTFDVDATPVDLGGVLELRLPRQIEANLRLDGTAPASCLSFELKTDDPVTISIPREQGFVFVVSELLLGSAGLTLTAQVRKGPAQVEIPVLDQSLTVRESDGEIGRFRIDRGRLVSASLAAQVRLRVFDDAQGVLTLRMTQNEGGWRRWPSSTSAWTRCSTCARCTCRCWSTAST